MRNATLSVLWLLLLGTGSWASTAAAQTDDTEASGDTEGDSSAGGADEAAAPSDEAAPEASDTTADSGSQLAAPSGDSASAGESELQEGDLDEGSADATDSASDEAETEEEEAAEEAAGPPPLPWRNTFFTWSNQVTFNSFVRDAQLTYNPTLWESFYISPRWYLSPTSYFVVNEQLNIEVTDTDGYALNRDPQIGDLQLQYRQMIPWEGFVFLAMGNLYFPLSKSSQAVHRYLGAGVALTVVRSIAEAGLTLAGLFSYSHWFAGSNVAQVGTPQPDMCPQQAPSGNGFGSGPDMFNTVSCDQIGGPTAGRDTLYAGLSVTETIENFSISGTFLFYNVYGYELAPAYIQVDTSQDPLMIADGSPTHWRNYTYFSLQVAYQFLPWLNVALGIQNSYSVASAYNPDGSIRNPIFSPDTQAYLQATVQIDEIYTEISGAGEEDLTPQERQRRRQGLASRPSVGGTF